jgi:hypothetical protein
MQAVSADASHSVAAGASQATFLLGSAICLGASVVRQPWLYRAHLNVGRRRPLLAQLCHAIPPGLGLS